MGRIGAFCGPNTIPVNTSYELTVAPRRQVYVLPQVSPTRARSVDYAMQGTPPGTDSFSLVAALDTPLSGYG